VKPADRDAYRAWQLLLQLFLAQRKHLPASAACDLSPAQCQVLHLIEPWRPIPMRRLAELLACDASNVTGLIDRLEARGLVQRRASPEDRRVKALDLTPTGAQLRAELLKGMTRRPLPLSRLSAEDQRTLLRILQMLVESRDA
jgi:DNA-binding MarR family transcriptional regulator